MNFRKIIIVLFFVFLFSQSSTALAQTSNTGFIPSNIWYSKDPFEEGDKIQIYTLVFNPNSKELSGVVFFFDKDTILGKKSFIVPPKGVKDVSINWTVTAGDHKIYGKIENAKYLISKDKYEDVYLSENQTEESVRSVNKKIPVKLTDLNNTEGIFDKANSFIDPITTDIGNLINKNTPDMISKPAESSISSINKFIENTENLSNNKIAEIKKDIKILNTNIANKEDKNSKLLKPFKYLELFIFSTLSFVFNKKLIFYSLLLIIIFISIKKFIIRV